MQNRTNYEKTLGGNLLKILCPLISAILTWLAFRNENLGILSLISMVPFFAYIEKNGRYANSVFLFQFFYHFLLLTWLFHLCPLTMLNLNKGQSYCVIIVLILLISLLISFIFTLPFKITEKVIKNYWTFIFMFTFSEWLIGVIGKISFPWGRIGTILYGYPNLLHISTILGSLGMTVFILLSNVFLTKGVYFKKIYLLAWVFLITINFLWGTVSIDMSDNNEKINDQDTLRVSILQGGIAREKKWKSSKLKNINKYLRMAEEASNTSDLIVFPETAIPIKILDNENYLNRFIDITNKKKCTLIVGAFEKKDENKYNVLYGINPDGTITQPHCKGKLVPFGEYMPFSQALSKKILNKSCNTLISEESAILDTSVGKIAGLICYESVFPNIARELLGKEKGQLLVISSNDSWFKNSPALSQHLGHNVMRSVENGRFCVIAGNTGISAIVDINGRIKNRLPIEVEDALWGKCTLTDRRTIYSYIGDIIVLPGLLMIILSFYLNFIEKNYKKC